MKRATNIAAAVSLSLLLAQASGCDRGKNIAGTWTTQFEGNGGRGVYIVVLSQHGSDVAGTYRGEASDASSVPSGTISGRFRRDVLRATWMEQDGTQGWLNFKFDESARAFNGEWGNVGRPMGGAWNGTRNP